MFWELLPVDNHDTLYIAGEAINSRLWLGTSQYASPQQLVQALTQANPGFVTMSLRRQTAQQLNDNGHWHCVQQWLAHSSARILPNTAGCHSAQEAITLARMARQLFGTSWIKLEVIGDDYSLQPNPFELVRAATQLVEEGFQVLPYCTDDLAVAQELVAIGCVAVMPWAAPIGTGKGIMNPYLLSQLRERLDNTVLIIDAGLGKPSHAAAAMEMGFDAVLLNTAVAHALDPVAMASAFAHAVQAGRLAYHAGCMAERTSAQPSTSPIDLPFWRHSEGGVS